MKIIALKYYDGGYMTQAFAFGGTRPKEECEDVKYRSSLQNFLIDDGKDVILSDTGLPNNSQDILCPNRAPLYGWATKWLRLRKHSLEQATSRKM